MKASPDAEGNLFLHVETPSDWEILSGIAPDGAGCNLAEAMGGLMQDGPAGRDWKDFVVPELADAFSKQSEFIACAVAGAQAKAHGGPGSILIRRVEAEIWYGALNQARLALENRHELASVNTPEEVMDMSRARRSAFFRSDTYLRIQSILLDYMMRL